MKHPRLFLKPTLLAASAAYDSGIITYNVDGTARIIYEGEERLVPNERQYDLTQATIFGLNERLTMSATSPVIGGTGETLRDLFNEEWERYSTILAATETKAFPYGYYAYYPAKNDLVRFCPPFWHRLVAVASSSKLLADRERRLSWKEIRDILGTTTVGVAGCSVGSSVVHSAVMDLRPCQIKVADKSVYKMENINRVKLAYWDIVRPESKRLHPLELPLKNKAEVVAEQLYAIDPYIDVYVYNEGLTPDTITSFFDGQGEEPPLDIVVEEVDDPRVKLIVREEARKRGLPVVMVTDIGSSVQLDVLRYDQDRHLPLTWGTSDETLYQKMEAVYRDGGNRRVFFEFVDALIGTDYRHGELKHIIEEQSEIPTSTIIPQLGSTAAKAGAIAAETIARIRLGHHYPERVLINKHTFEVRIYRR